VFELDDRYQRLLQEACSLATAVEEHANQADESLSVHPPMREALQASGLVGLCVPEEYGGREPTVDPLAITVVREGLMATSAHLDGLFAMQGVGSYALSQAGTAALRKEWLPRVASLQSIAALALTEPDVGSDLRAITTTVRDDDEELILNGHKAFITNVGAADFYTVLCREGEGYTLVLVPSTAAGLSIEVGPRLIAPHIIGDLRLDDVRVPLDHRIGLPGEAFTLVLATLATFRVSVAGAAVGLAQAALIEAVRHTSAREQFGEPLAAIGPIPHMLGSSWVEVEAARALTYKAASLAVDDPLRYLDWSSMAKVAATEAAGRITDRAVQMMGRFGLVSGSKIERLYRNARPMRIYEGGNEVLTGQLSRRLRRRLP
jgi:acyl-CoA dehydrogenase